MRNFGFQSVRNVFWLMRHHRDAELDNLVRLVREIDYEDCLKAQWQIATVAILDDKGEVTRTI